MEGDAAAINTWKDKMISTHALTWRATRDSACTSIVDIFLPTPSHGGRRQLRHDGIKWSRFLPTPSHGGRPVAGSAKPQRRHFYPRPHMEGDSTPARVRPWMRISTHALTWRATEQRAAESVRRYISTHALTWRATETSAKGTARCKHFYPRPHMEGD